MATTRSTPTGLPRPNALAIEWVFPRSRVTYIGARGTLGRGDSCAVVLRGQEVSRSHCELTPGPGTLIIEDLGSRNGTFVNGRRVAKAKLSAGSVLRLGDWIGLVRPSAQLTPRNLEFGEVAPHLYGSGAIRQVIEAARAVAPKKRPVVIVGETGTGKALVAEFIHEISQRPGRLEVMDCAAVPAPLAEAELFGATPDDTAATVPVRAGHLHAAHRGTLLLKDATCLPLSVQSMLLDTLTQASAPRPGSKPGGTDVRLVVTTREPLNHAIEAGRLSPELFRWLDNTRLCVPSLRDRVEDIAPLFLHFVRELSARSGPDIDPRLIERLCLYDWPYNVQELRGLVQRLLSAPSKRGALTASLLPGRMASQEISRTMSQPAEARAQTLPDRGATSSSGTLLIDRGSQDDERTLMMLVDALRFCQHDLHRACSMIGISNAEASRLLESAAFLEAQQEKILDRRS